MRDRESKLIQGSNEGWISFGRPLCFLLVFTFQIKTESHEMSTFMAIETFTRLTCWMCLQELTRQIKHWHQQAKRFSVHSNKQRLYPQCSFESPPIRAIPLTCLTLLALLTEHHNKLLADAVIIKWILAEIVAPRRNELTGMEPGGWVWYCETWGWFKLHTWPRM